MSLCDTCSVPGACCKRLKLSRANGDEFTYWSWDDPIEALRETIGDHPFIPTGEPSVYMADAGEYRSTTWTCTQLNGDGRCSIYDSRPQLCRDYQPGQDKLCVYHQE